MRHHFNFKEMASHPRGFLANWSPDVVYVVNGHPVTRDDILDAKRARQKRILDDKLRQCDPLIKPCFIRTFHNDSWVYSGWWLYIETRQAGWPVGLDLRRRISDPKLNYNDLTLRIMRFYPCGLLPISENFTLWKAAFAKIFHYPTAKRPKNNGLVKAWAKVSLAGTLIDIYKDKPDEYNPRLIG